jgi:lysophospholipase L1-like esterase
MIARRTACAAVLIALCALHSAGSSLRAATFEFQDGDRVVLLGSTFIERAQRYGYIEAELTAALAGQGKTVTFRNLGWSGDTVWAESRGIFDPPAEGYKRMIEQVKGLKPTVIVFYYGANEAYAGEAGLEPFVKQYNKLLDDLKPTGARYILISPLDHLKFSDLHPDPAEYNAKAKVYRDAIEELAEKRDAFFVDLAGPLGEKIPLGTPEKPAAVPATQMTDTGVHLNAYGYKVIAEVLGVPEEDRKSIEINTDIQRVDDKTAKVAIPFTLKYDRVMFPSKVKPTHWLKFTKIPDGRHTLKASDKETLTLSREQWAKGAPVDFIDYEQFEKLRQTIVEKNKLYFYRWRPQNVTYLFLFRKHEQGQNAAEIPQFDPLVEAKEKEIADLSTPRTHTLKLYSAK